MPPTGLPYHHGALREALIDATEALLAEKGPDAFSLREVARRAGVSPAAPAHHFGDAAGLLTAVATIGFEGLTQALAAGQARGGTDPRTALREQGLAYVRFALRHPGRFRLMFRPGQLHDDPELERHGRAAYEVLADGVRRALAGDEASHTPVVVTLWSLVHGHAHLAIAGKLGPLTGGRALPDWIDATLPAMLDATLQGLLPAPPRRVSRGRSASRPASPAGG
jgi:AcrR family transcriptional regulator